jgi:D-alanyl-D-alanine dipeptidase
MRTIVLAAAALLPSCMLVDTSDDPVAGSRQVILVTTPHWGAVDGTLWRLERDHASAAWRMAAPPVAIQVGRNGLAWGRGEHGGGPLGPGPEKREGDGRAPAGVFALRQAFGYGDERELPGLRLPYLRADDRHRCVDDPASAFYNQILDRTLIPRPDWRSAEQMRREDQLYRYGIVVEHNTEPVLRGAGSCIFLHLGTGPGRGTAGCTAMGEASMRDLLLWLDPARAPRLVQLPAHVLREDSRWHALRSAAGS